MTCAHCSGPIVIAARGRVAKYCSGRCRVAAYRARKAAEPKLPREMTSLERWVRRQGKRPLTVRGAAASVTNRRTWASHEAAVSSQRGDGIGFVLGAGVGCIDLDDCIVGGKVEPWAQEILDRCPPTYVEVSMSGRGLHIFGLLPEGAGRGQRGGDRIEWYSVGRYIAVTGDRFEGAPARLADLREVVASLP